jgi:outer membrane protein assembly factor BamB
MHRTGRRLLVPAALCAALLTAGCGSDGPVDAISSMNPFKAEEQRLPGDRRAVLEGADPAAGVVGGTASVGGATALSDWPQPGGNAANDPGNVSAGATGARVWSVRAGEAGSAGGFGLSTGKGIRLSARPIVAGGTVYVYDPAGNVSAHALASGGRVWRVNVRPKGESEVVNGGGVAYADGRIYAATGFGQMVALDAASGSEVWRSSIEAPARGAPTAAGGKVFVVTQSGAVIALDAGTGAKVWSGTSGGTGAGLLSSSSPAVTGSTVIAPTSSGEILAFDAATGARKWGASVAGGSRVSAVTGLQDASASPVVHDGIVYATGVGGRVIAVRADTGETVWNQQIGSAHTPVVSGGALFLVDLSDRLVAFDRAKGTVLWAAQLPRAGKGRTTWAGPVLAGGRLWVVSVDGQVVMADAATGQLGQAGAVGVEGSIAPIAVGGRILVLGGEGTLVALN